MSGDRMQRETHYSHERNPRTPRARREGASARSSASSARSASSSRPSAVNRSQHPDYGYVGGKPARTGHPSDQRVSGWTSNRRGSGYASGRGGGGRNGGRGGGQNNSSLLSRIIPIVAVIAVIALLLFAGTRVVSCISSSSAGQGGSEPSGSSGGIFSDITDAGASNVVDKLAGATETVDENGIVHGVTPAGIRYTVNGRGKMALQADKVTLVAAGDQIGTDNSMPLADRYAGSRGDGLYDFTPFYQEVEPFIQSYDLRYINQETVMAGADKGYSGYPVFNSPDACAEAIAEVGFNLVNFATNHTYDMGLAGIERSHEVWDRYPELLIGGSYLTQEDRETVHMIERNGMTFAFLAYTYGDNYWGTADNFPNSYYLCGFDEELMTADIRRAQQVADVVIVSMHWGDEYISEPNDSQYAWARFLADLDVDLVLGSHAHIMQPTRYITGDSGNTIPVVFGLSDFVSGWTLVDTILSGLFTCDFVRTDSGDVEVQNLKWYPTIEWSDGGTVYVRFLKDMDEATTNANTRTDDIPYGTDYQYLRDKVNSVGMEIPVIM